MTFSANYIYVIVLLPLLMSIIAGVFGPKIGHKNAMRLTCGGLTVSAVLSLVIFVSVCFGGHEVIRGTLMTWISTGSFDVSFGVMVDKLTATMLLVVTLVSACVHYYSVGYMAHDPSKSRFFSYLSLFTFTMLTLVTAPNLLQMFMGWEGVGLASYLLIGFWFKKDSANAASIKAFLVNRVADLGLLLAIFTVFITLGTLDYQDIFANLGQLEGRTFAFFGTEFQLTSLIAMFLFIGAMGKSAQLGFHTWLPDAMEGPTPVSALIHAATMVTAGVFLVARMSPLFEMAPQVLEIVAWVGGLTALFAATIGLVQNDIKRVIAYSTCSQLGYMFFACGIGAYPAAIFHLTTHAFFKALLFLGAGSVIHAVADEQDMRKMGGLKMALPITYGLIWIGSLALAGIPPFAGFFSKDLILESAFMSHTNTGTWMYVMGVTAALMTAFYSFRVLFLTFHGKFRGEEKSLKHAHESPVIMLVPMIVLMFGAIFSGWLLHGMGETEWWDGAIVVNEALHTGLLEAHHIPATFKYLPLVIVLLGVFVAFVFYIKNTKIAPALAGKLKAIYCLFLNKWFIDELYNALIVVPVRFLSKFLWQRGDVKGIDKLGPNGAAWITYAAGGILRRMQTGYVFHYAFIMVIGLAVILSWVLWLN